MAGSGSPTNRMTYSGYLRLDELLQLQAGPEGHIPSPSNDEMHFIITHQAFELWFKQVRAELDAVHGYLSQESVDGETLASDCSSFGASHRNLPPSCQSMESYGNTESPRLPCIPG